MKGNDIIKYLENWAPRHIAWERDNVGLQVGTPNSKIKNIQLCLDVTENVIDDAIKKNCNFIISHHPLLFIPTKKIDPQNDRISALIQKLIKNDITLYSAHTNLDAAKDGVSFALAEKLKLTDVDFLSNLKSNQFKVVVFVPADSVDKVAAVIFEAGGGIIGEYSGCSFRTKGEGTFRGSEKSNPTVGSKGKFEKAEEIKLEVLVDSWKLNGVLSNMISAHPYEEVAYDVYPLANRNVNYGMGAIGYLKNPIRTSDFLAHVSKNLGAKNLRHTKSNKRTIKKVAVCGGAGSDLIKNAVAAGADAYVTGDIKYHQFQDAEDKILLIDAGHYETEIHSLDFIKNKLTEFITDKKIKVFKYRGSTNPVIFYNN